MAFSIKQIKAVLSENGMPLEGLDKAAEEICSRHTTDLESIKEERDSYKHDAETLATVQKELDDLKTKDAEEAKAREGKDYDKLFSEFEDYKKQIANEKKAEAVKTAYTAFLKDLNVSESGITKILKYASDGVELDDEGKIKDAGKLKKAIKDEWSEYITTETVKGADTPNPPANTGGAKKSKDEIMKIEDATERQKAISENLEAFGLS